MNAQPTVVIVDDNPAIRDSLGFLIGSVGRRVETYASAEEFLEAYDNERPGCVVLDVRMPGLSGLELMEKLKDDRFAPPVVLITGHGDIPMGVQAMRDGGGKLTVRAQGESDGVVIEIERKKPCHSLSGRYSRDPSWRPGRQLTGRAVSRPASGSNP